MKRLILFMSLLSVMIISVNGADYNPIVREGVKWVYYDYQHQNYENPLEPPKVIFFPIVYEFKRDEENPESEFLVLWEDHTYLKYLTGEIMREIKPVARACDIYLEQHYLPYDRHTVIAKRVGSQEPLIGNYLRTDEDGPVYEIYDFPLVSMFFDRVRLTKTERENMYTFIGKGTVKMEDGSERECWNSVNPAFKLIDGIGFVATDWSNTNNSVLNFIDLANKKQASIRVLSHVIENGVIIYKSPCYDIIQANVYDPDKPNGNTAVEDVEAVPDESPGDGLYYDMQGRAVAEPTAAGIYVRNGKKIIVNK